MNKKKTEEKGRVNSGEQNYSGSSRFNTNNGIAVHVHQQDHCMDERVPLSCAQNSSTGEEGTRSHSHPDQSMNLDYGLNISSLWHSALLTACLIVLSYRYMFPHHPNKQSWILL